MASAGVRREPPSENESGVILTTPMIPVRIPRGNARVRSCQSNRARAAKGIFVILGPAQAVKVHSAQRHARALPPFQPAVGSFLRDRGRRYACPACGRAQAGATAVGSEAHPGGTGDQPGALGHFRRGAQRQQDLCVERQPVLQPGIERQALTTAAAYALLPSGLTFTTVVSATVPVGRQARFAAT